MCVIAYKPLGVTNFDKETLNKCWLANSDGGGFSWFCVEDGLWHVQKGFMSWKKFWKAYKQHDFNESKTVVCHFRIGTAGLKDGGNTHPFPITNDMEFMRQTTFATDTLIFHNGVVGHGEDKFSDTMVHVRDYIEPLIHLLGENPKIVGIYNKLLGEGSSKWILTKGDKLWRFGNNWVEDDGRFYSNTHWKWKTATVHSVGTGWTGNYGKGYTNAYGRYENGVWKSWEKTPAAPTTTNFPLMPKNEDGTTNFAKNAKRKTSTPKEKEVHTQTLFVVAGEDGSIKFAERSIAFLNKYGSGYLICPNCYEDKYLDNSPHPEGDTLCQSCGAVFLDWTGEIIMYDLDTVRKLNKTYETITQSVPTHLTAEERQRIIDAQTEELMHYGYC
jgi:hypothetical protein